MTRSLPPDELRVLAGNPMFGSLSESSLAEVLASCRRRRCKVGTLLFHEGADAEAFYVVLSGRVKVYKLSPRGDEQILHLCGPGQAFAEAAVLTAGQYPGFAEAVADATILEVPRAGLRDALARSAEVAMGMMAGLSSKLREFNRLIEQLSLRDVPARLAAALAETARAVGRSHFRLGMTKRQLAARIGTTPETLSRCLRKLRDAGIIATRGAEIRILDAHALADAAHPA